jgi:hypothetical protein
MTFATSPSAVHPRTNDPSTNNEHGLAGEEKSDCKTERFQHLSFVAIDKASLVIQIQNQIRK